MKILSLIILSFYLLIVSYNILNFKDKGELFGSIFILVSIIIPYIYITNN